MMKLFATVKYGIELTFMNAPMTSESVSNERRDPALSTGTKRRKEKIWRTTPQLNPPSPRWISGCRRRMNNTHAVKSTVGQEPHESRRHEQRHDRERQARVGVARRRDTVECEQCIQAQSNHQRDEPEEQIQSRAAADRLVETAAVTLGGMLSEVTNGRHRHA